jgi:predicted RNase H-like nuclease (RuvC/YqgF family)
MTDDLVARVRSPFALTERDEQEIADALEARGKRIDELESRLVDKEVRIAELEAALNKYKEDELLLSKDGVHFRKAIDVIKEQSARIAELESALTPLAFRKEIELTLENGGRSVKAIVILEAEREAAIKLLNGEKQ